MKSWWLRFVPYSVGHWHGLLFILLLMLIDVGLNALTPWPMKLLVDYVLISEPFPTTWAWLTTLPNATSAVGLIGWLAGSTIVLFSARQIMLITREYIQTSVGNRMVYDLAASSFYHVQRLSLSFHGQKRAGDLVQRLITDSTCIRELVIEVFVPFLTSLVSLVVMFVVMWQLDSSLSVFAILFALPMGVIIQRFGGIITERTYQQQELNGDLMALAEQTLTALPVVQAFSREAHEDARFRGLSGRLVKAYLRVTLCQKQFDVGIGAVSAVGTATIVGIGGLHVLEGRLSLGSLLVFLSYLASLYSPVETLAHVSSKFAAAAARGRRVLEILDVNVETHDTPNAQPLAISPSTMGRSVRLDGVTFGYKPNRPILKEVTLEAQPGEIVALVGPTGAGKSTLVSLIPRFFDPWQGQITINEQDVRDIQLESLRSQVVLMLQEPFLLPLTVAENIAYGRQEASKDEIVAAAVAARADQFIGQLPEGYNTILGERGATLSGGQRQRLSIARALLKNAPVLILDEPTSALDSETEAFFLEALERLIEGRTTFIIAHRLSTIQRADRIIVLEAGRIVETGTHQELLDAGGLYHRLHQIQFGHTNIPLNRNEQ